MLPVVLNQVDVIGGGEETRKGRGGGVPQRRRDNTCWHTGSAASSKPEPSERTILDQDGEALLDQQAGVEDDQTKAQRQDIVARAELEEIADFLLD